MASTGWVVLRSPAFPPFREGKNINDFKDLSSFSTMFSPLLPPPRKSEWLNARIRRFQQVRADGVEERGERGGTQGEIKRKPAPVLAFCVPGNAWERMGIEGTQCSRRRGRCKANAQPECQAAKGKP